ncbi:clarin-3 [Anomaloglossus baeobatrachus]|uniref:clarin-3 n=1 Tax=Anomaloglossus baeobatrachus TaxID=238106 RepID=UPI003F4FC612
MPSKQKTLLFSAGFVSSIGSFVIICTCLGTPEWVSSKIQFTGTNYSGIADVNLGLFQTSRAKTITGGVGLHTPKTQHEVLQILTDTNGIKIIHILVIILLVIGLVSSFLGSLTTCLNSVSNPYLTFLGPLGVYVWTGINGIPILLAMILFAINVEVNKLPKEIAIVLDGTNDVFGSTQNTYGYSFWLLLLSLFLNIGTILIINYYQHMRNSQQVEKERPMETASRDVILF